MGICPRRQLMIISVPQNLVCVHSKMGKKLLNQYVKLLLAGLGKR